MMEKNLNHHNMKWAAGDQISIAEFIMASWIGNFVMNEENPYFMLLQATLDETPKFKDYCDAILNEFSHLRTRGNVGPF